MTFLVWQNLLRTFPANGKKAKVAVALEGLTDADIWKEVQRRKSGAPKEDKSIKQAEVETLFATAEEVGTDTPQGDFFGCAIKLDKELRFEK